MKIEGDLRAEHVDIHGMLTVGGSAFGETLETDGGLKLGEMRNLKRLKSMAASRSAGC